jgi:hypothetical protein
LENVQLNEGAEEVGKKWGRSGEEVGKKWGRSGEEVGKKWGRSGEEVGIKPATSSPIRKPGQSNEMANCRKISTLSEGLLRCPIKPVSV